MSTIISHLRELQGKATKGEWFLHMQGGGKGGPNRYVISDKKDWGYTHGESKHIAIVEPVDVTPDETGRQRYAGYNAAYIIAIHNALPKLLELAEAAETVDYFCRLRERESGHRTDCWMPRLQAALQVLTEVKTDE